MPQTCSHCHSAFEVTPEDLAFLEKISPIIAGRRYDLPPPTLCPTCRQQRRLAFRNERVFYHRKCDLTGKQIISVHAPKKPYPVYEQHEWWKDTWDALSYGKEFNPSLPFFSQLKDLLLAVPQMNLINEANENADYCQLTANNRNCYLIVESSNNEDCFYGYWLQKCSDCCDTSFSHESRQCYETDNCYNCERLLWSQNCTNCSDSAFLRNCIGCSDCLFCVNMHQKRHCIFNEELSAEEYKKRKSEILNGSAKTIDEALIQFHAFRLKFPHKAAETLNTEECTGDYIRESKHCRACFDAFQAEDCTYAEHVWRGAKDVMDASTVGRSAECVYEAINTGIGVSHIRFANQCWSDSSELTYCSNCFSCSNCFGCVGLKRKEFCILNKQYTKEEYETLVPQIIEHMRQTKEWGEYPPPSLSLFGYNETVAQEVFPMSRDVVVAHGWNWQEEEDPRENYLGPPVDPPDRIADVSDDITKQILRCAVTGKPYKIIPQELAFYRTHSIPLPRVCPDERHRRRMQLRNPQRLWDRACAKCSAAIQTTYSPERPEIVYCEQCYQKEVY